MEARASIVLNVEWVQCNLSCKIVKNRRIRNGIRTEWSPIWSVIITITKFSNLIGYQLPWFQFWFKKEPYISQILSELWLIGNRTSCRPIRSVIINSWLNKSVCMITDQIGLYSVLSPLIDLVTVFDAILTSRQTREKLQCLYENLMSNNFRRTAVLKTKLWFVN